MTKDNLLDLSSWKRCIIESVERDPKTHDLIIGGYEDARNVASSSQNVPKEMVCRLKHSWSSSRIEQNDVVSLKATWDTKGKGYCVTSSSGFVVTKPDVLISGTTVVSGLFCQRKAVLSDRFKGVDSNSKIVRPLDLLLKIDSQH